MEHLSSRQTPKQPCGWRVLGGGSGHLERRALLMATRLGESHNRVGGYLTYPEGPRTVLSKRKMDQGGETGFRERGERTRKSTSLRFLKNCLWQQQDFTTHLLERQNLEH